MTASSLAGVRVVVMGLGHFGGGIGVARWLVEQGARVTVTDQASPDKLADSVRQLEGLPVQFRLGGHDVADLEDCQLLVVSPAVPKDRSPFVAEAVARSIAITSEMNLFLERCPVKRVIGVTGSAGKSTTTAMLGAILRGAAEALGAPHVFVGGNIGQSLLAELPRMDARDVIVLELSSFQLEDMAALPWSPPLAVITNLQPNHLDRHKTMEAYAGAKLNIARYQSADGRVFVREGDEVVAEQVRAIGAGDRLVRFAFDSRWSDVLRLPGRHNRDNAAAAIAVCHHLGVDDALIRRGLADFHGLEHRLEFVAERGGVRYYNDSKSTTPASAELALESFEAPVIMLVGGGDKGMSFDGLAARLAAVAKAVVCYGQTGPAIHLRVRRSLAEAGGTIPVELATDFGRAVDLARGLALPGDVVVLSPACTSYDMFANYEERGETFRRLVRAMPV
ncbi:MAG: UDP-N-acetylmuramoyl-L-alanine--D-glutamate ligase [Phycisphaerae bacterium]|nr:UDP-N-acetylmuramoyl-L-alanine--D-glutamate ligase [Phycisphaerae bacterium]